MTSESSQPPAGDGAKGPRAASGTRSASRLAGAFFRETWWLLRETALYLARAVMLGWDRLRLRRHRSRRKWILEGVGEEIRKRPELSDSLAPLARSFDEVEAQAADRRRRLLEPWQALPAWRRAWVRAAVLLLVGALALILLPAREPAPPASPPAAPVPATTDATKPPPVDRAAQVKTFGRARDAAAAGQWVLFPGNPVLSRGALDAWDDFKVGSPVVLREGGPLRKRFRIWYRGCHFIGDEYACGVGSAISRDGIVWEKSSTPVLVPEDPIDRERLRTVALVRAGDRTYLWYSVDTDVQTERPAIIVLATSEDGSAWKIIGPVLSAVSAASAHLDPAALHDGKRFHLWYVDAATPAGKPALLHVTSPDGRQWQIAGSTSIDELGLNPGRVWVVPDGRGGYLAHFAHGRFDQRQKGLFGVMASGDGNVWRLRDDDPKLRVPAFGNGDVADAPAVLSDGDSLWMWFVLQPRGGADTIGAAFMKEPAP